MTDREIPALDGELEPEERTADVVVIGGGVAGMVAALECAKVGLRVSLLERSDQLGGCVGRIELDGLTLDSGAESFATRGGAVAEMLTTLGLEGDIEKPNPAGAWLVMPGPSGGTDAAPLPRTGMLGIPANPLGDDVRRIIGWRGAIRAYADRLIPILKIGRYRNLGHLVSSRMGQAVLDRLVTPISAGVYSTDPNELDLDVVAPGLNQAMTRTGSLSGGVGQLVEERKAGSAVLGLRGGMHRLVDALAVQLDRFGVEVVRAAEATRLARMSPTGSDSSEKRSQGWRVEAGTAGGILRYEVAYVIVAAPSDTSRRLLDEAALGRTDAATLRGPQGGAWPPAASVDIVTLVLDAPELAAAPRGTGVLVAAGTPGIAAKALTHSTAKWRWLADAAAPRQVVRLSYGRAGEPGPLTGLDEGAVTRLALADASALLGVPLDGTMLRAAGRTSWRDALSQATLGQRDRVRDLEQVLAAEPGIEATGSWVAGTGLASVIPHALEAARRIRHLAVRPGGHS
ncbi:NAD(P)/FAD-dependent oxidoreductase [Agromyces sp. Marseille-P2726]|uniref:protoporphyrinogen/coproporphyrinogen oxidase n=1 Tax=Agromyces sp. Marseille-P2726 TaxID=2709132 RepID=UPI00156DC29C|nr:FAD-dependent oxidoreductase [Agromyces sp. Marseille-P2726]